MADSSICHYYMILHLSISMLNKLYDLITTKKYIIGQYTVEVLAQISEGGFAYIYKVKDTNSGLFYAMKKILLQNEKQEQIIKGEVTLWVIP